MHDKDQPKQMDLARILDIPVEETDSLRKFVDSGEFKFADEAVERDIF